MTETGYLDAIVREDRDMATEDPINAKLRALDKIFESMQVGKAKKGYNDYRNYETWNVALWISNDEGLYNLARECQSYAAFQETLCEFGTTETPDHVAYNDSGLDTDALNRLIQELRGEE